MVKCLECGAEERRLQWTHFKFKCTGRFKNGKEYMLAYPGAKIIDSELASKTAVTLDNLILKYGKKEGELRWKKYKEKQAYSNSFEYKKEKYGWSYEQFISYNASRAVTIKNMISKYGEDIGVSKWIEYCERQAYTNTKDYFLEKYGIKEGLQKYLEVNKKKSVNNPKNLAEKLNISLDAAVEIIISQQNSILYSSNLELEFVSELEKLIGTLEYSNKTRPYGKWSTLLDTYVIFDIKHKNCIIEFNGDYWHANPNLFADTAIIRGKAAKDIWKRDELKLQTAVNLGFKTLVVWESDFKKDKKQTIERVAAWILKEHH